MTLMSRRRALMAQAAGSILPPAYQQVEWIQSDGNQQISLSSDGMTSSEIKKYILEADVSIHETNSSTGVIVGIGSSAGAWLGVVSSGTKIGLGSSVYFQNVTISQRHTYRLDISRGTSSYATCDGGSEISRTQSLANGGYLTLFGAREQSGWAYKSKCRMYLAKVWYNGTIIKELYPCYRKLDNVIGMYDIVNDTFYTNSGSGTFAKGSDV